MTIPQAHLLDGVTVPVVTPMTPDREPDARLLTPLLASFADAGIDTIMLLGTNGEGATLDPDAAGRFAREATAMWRDRRGPSARVLIAVFGAGTAHLMASGQAMVKAKPDAIVAAPPHYFVHTESELLAHFAATEALGLPVIAYNIPRYSGNPITPALLERLAGLDHIIGLKDSGGGDEIVPLAVRIAATRADFAVSQGNEKKLDWAIAEGARGITPGVGNLAPALSLALVAAARAGDLAEAARIQSRLSALTTIHTIRPGVAAMKAALSLLKLAPPTPGAPFEAYRPDELGRLHAVLAAEAESLSLPLPPLGAK
ncbi:MAG: dihydrodipicolinate synthase family protein [Devosia sp.]